MIAAVRRFALILISCISSYLPLLGETIDEVVAAVGNTPILRSDLALAALVRLGEPDDKGSADEDPSRLLALDVESARATLVARAGGWDALEPALAAHGLTDADLDELSLRVAAVNAYIEQRLRPRVRVTSEDVKAAYQELIVAEAQRSGGEPPPLESVQDRLHRLLVERSLNDEIERWLESAAEQNEVTRFHQR
jgi:hypothetical protein